MIAARHQDEGAEADEVEEDGLHGAIMPELWRVPIRAATRMTGVKTSGDMPLPRLEAVNLSGVPAESSTSATRGSWSIFILGSLQYAALSFARTLVSL